MIIIIILIVISLYFINKYYNYFDNLLDKKDKIFIKLDSEKELHLFGNKKLKIDNDNDICERIDDKDKLEFECQKPKKGEHKLQFGNYSENIIIDEDKYTYSYNIDKKEYFLKEVSLKLDNNNFNGKVIVVEKEKNTPKYVNTKDKFDLKIYESTFPAKIKNAEIIFSKSWEEFSNIYYLNNKLIVDFEIEKEKFFSYKPYFLTDGLDVNDIFSLGQNNEYVNLDQFLKIENNNLLIMNNLNKLPNINLFKIDKSEKFEGYMKFTIKNINSENKFNLFMNGKHIFKFEYPYFKFDIKDTNNDSSLNRINIDGISFLQDFVAPYEKEVKLINNKIEYMNFLIEKKNDNCKISVNIDKYKKVIEEFSCIENEDEYDSIVTQLNIETSKCLDKKKKCILFEISNLETGLDYSISPTREYSY